MKKILLSLIAAAAITAPAVAQHCALASINIPTQALSGPGLSPASQDLPCSVIGTPVNDTIYFQNFTSVSGFPVTSLKIDSINNLPPGLCWVTNVANNTFAGGADGVIYVSGTPTGPAGQYQLNIIVTVDNVVTEAASAAGLRYYVRTICSGATTCPNIDTTQNSLAFIAYAACAGPPTAVVTPASAAICTGKTQVLSATSVAGYTYKWNTGATTDTIHVSGAGSYFVTVYNGSDSTISNTVVTTSIPSPTVSVSPAGPDSICQGDTATLTATGTGSGLTYLWSSTATTASTIATIGGNYTVTVTAGNGCSVASTPVTVVTQSLPAANVSQNGLTLTATAGGASYQWYENGNAISAATSPSFTAAANGSYTVLVTAADGCTKLSAATDITNVGITDVSGNIAIRLYPNPSQGLFTLETAGRTGDTYTIYDELGRTVQAKSITGTTMLIDMSAQGTGSYLMTVKHGGSSETVRFAITK